MMKKMLLTAVAAIMAMPSMAQYVGPFNSSYTEEHNVIGGLGAAVSEVVGETCPVPVVKHGVEDVFGHSGTAEALMIKYGLTPEKIAAKAKEAIALKK